MDEELRKFAEDLVRVCFFMENIAVEAFAMTLFLKKKGLWEEYMRDKELSEEVKKIIGKIMNKIVKEEYATHKGGF